MQKNKMLSDIGVTYIRVRKIFHAFLLYRYGSLPIDLPSGCLLYNRLVDKLVPNYSLRKMSYSSFSQEAYNKSLSMDDNQVRLQCQERKIYMPTSDDRLKLVPFVMPRSIIFGGVHKATDRWFQLSNTSEFCKAIENEFWDFFIDTDRKYSVYCMRNGKEYKHEDSVENFMQLVGMDFDDEETLIRYWRSKRNESAQDFGRFCKRQPNSSLMQKLGISEVV